MGIGENIKRLREAANMSQKELAMRVGVKQPTIAQLEGGDSKTSKHVFKIAKALGVQPHEIGPDIPVQSTPVDIEGMPVMGEVRAGAWLEIDGDSEPIGTVPAAPDYRYRGNRQYALKIIGTSMDKVAPAGTFVIVVDWSDNGTELKDGDLVVVRRERAQTYEVTLKRAKKGAVSWELWPESNDPKHQEPIILQDGDREVEVVVIGKVVGKYEPL